MSREEKILEIGRAVICYNQPFESNDVVFLIPKFVQFWFGEGVLNEGCGDTF